MHPVMREETTYVCDFYSRVFGLLDIVDPAARAVKGGRYGWKAGSVSRVPFSDEY
jgi:hypothetical protein